MCSIVAITVEHIAVYSCCHHLIFPHVCIAPVQFVHVDLDVHKNLQKYSKLATCTW